MLLVDGGDIVGVNTPAEREKASFLLQAMKVMGYDVVTFGEREVGYGLDFLMDRCKKAKIDVVCANTFNVKNKKLVGKPFVVRKVNGIKVGITAVLGPDLAGTQLDEKSPYDVRDPKTALETVLPKMRRECDIVLVVSHLRTNLEAENIARNMKGIDIVLSSHDAGMLPKPTKAGDALVLRTGNRGQYVGKLILTLDSGGKVSSYQGEVVTLDSKIVANPGIAKLIDDFNAAAQKAAKNALLSQKKAEKIPFDRYLGSETCVRCHDGPGEQWASSGHAKAYLTLEDQRKEFLPECLKCHTTGYGEPGGYSGPGTNPHLGGVQCESCHGIGTKHEMQGAYGKVTEATCEACHDKRNSPEFDYKLYLKKISHKPAGATTSIETVK